MGEVASNPTLSTRNLSDLTELSLTTLQKIPQLNKLKEIKKKTLSIVRIISNYTQNHDHYMYYVGHSNTEQIEFDNHSIKSSY